MAAGESATRTIPLGTKDYEYALALNKKARLHTILPKMLLFIKGKKQDKC